MNWFALPALIAGLSVFAGCSADTSSEAVAKDAVTSPSAFEAPPLKCERGNYAEGIFDHFGRGRGADNPEDLAAPYLRDDWTAVVDATDATATVYVVTGDGSETLTIITGSNYGKGWLTDGTKSCGGSAANRN